MGQRHQNSGPFHSAVIFLVRVGASCIRKGLLWESWYRLIQEDKLSASVAECFVVFIRNKTFLSHSASIAHFFRAFLPSVLLNTPLEFSVGIGSHWPSMPCLFGRNAVKRCRNPQPPVACLQSRYFLWLLKLTIKPKTPEMFEVV